jgi:hypothetical protein
MGSHFFIVSYGIFVFLVQNLAEFVSPKYDEDGNPVEGASAAPKQEEAEDAMSEMSLSSDEDDDEAEIFPEWLEVQITHTSRAMMLQWARWARWNLKIKEEEKRENQRELMRQQRDREEGVAAINPALMQGMGGSTRATSRRGISIMNTDLNPDDDRGIDIDGEDI